MRNRIHILICICLLAPMARAQGVLVDRVVAVVGNRVITQSDWDEQQRFDALVNGKPVSSADFTPASLDRQLDQVLMQEQIKDMRSAATPPEQVKQQVLEFRKKIPHAQSDGEWKAMLSGYALTESDFERHVAAQLNLLRFIEVRFRPSVQVNPEQIESYYNESFLPELRKAGTSESAMPPVKDVQEQIRRILSEQRVNELLLTWINGLRAQGRIKRMIAIDKESQVPGK